MSCKSSGDMYYEDMSCSATFVWNAEIMYVRTKNQYDELSEKRKWLWQVSREYLRVLSKETGKQLQTNGQRTTRGDHYTSRCVRPERMNKLLNSMLPWLRWWLWWWWWKEGSKIITNLSGVTVVASSKNQSHPDRKSS